MQVKVFNSYRITHENGSIEDIVAPSIIQALENMDTPETESTVLQVFLVKKKVRTLCEDEKTEVLFSAVVADGGGGSVATPAAGRIHVGDMVQFKAVPDRGYEFVSWKLNGRTVCRQEVMNLVMPELEAGADTAVFTAEFRLSPVEWKAEVVPPEATAQGCLAFPSSGKTDAGGTAELLAVAKAGWKFVRWEKDGKEIFLNELLSVEVSPLAEGEKERRYSAVFEADGSSPEPDTSTDEDSEDENS